VRVTVVNVPNGANVQVRLVPLKRLAHAANQCRGAHGRRAHAAEHGRRLAVIEGETQRTRNK